MEAVWAGRAKAALRTGHRFGDRAPRLLIRLSGNTLFPLQLRSIEECLEQLSNCSLIARFAFPDHKRLPPGRTQVLSILPVPRSIPFQLRQPVVLIRLWGMRELAIMRMPEAPVNKNNLTPRGKNKVWGARKIFPMQTESVTLAMRNAPHTPLGQHVFAPNRSHVCASVHHPCPLSF